MSEPERPDPLDVWLQGSQFCVGEIFVERRIASAFTLCHRDDRSRQDLAIRENANAALEIARWDDAGNYRPLKTAPNLSHGWWLQLSTVEELRTALDFFYPGRLATYIVWQNQNLQPTPLRETLGRQTGLYRVAHKISDEQADELVAGFCRSDGGCLRTILWSRDAAGEPASRKLPASKFDPKHDQTGRDEHALPLLCQEACNFLIAAARKVVKDAE